MIKRLKRIIRKVFSKGKHQYLHKKNNLKLAISFVVANNIEGDYLEFGVFKGDSFIYAYKTHNELYTRYKKAHANEPENTFLNQNVRFFAFDSFKGLPDNNDQDIPIHWTGESPMSYPRYLFEKNLKKRKVNMNNVEIIEGFYDATLNPTLYNKLDLKKAAIIHIDCDLYESTKTVLDTIKPLIVEGTVIVFDDYFCYNLIASKLSTFSPASAFIINQRNDKFVIQH